MIYRGEIKMKKVIEIDFPDDFYPPEKFRGVTSIPDKNPCGLCLFFEWDDEYGEGYCRLSDNAEYPNCPIRKYFDK